MGYIPNSYLGLIALNRQANVRVIDNYGFEISLDPNIITWVDTTDPENAKRLNHHKAIGQYVCVGQWTDFDCGYYPPPKDFRWHPIQTPVLDEEGTTETTGGELDGDTTYYYAITALQGAGQTTLSNIVSVTTEEGTNTNTITINWEPIENATSYYIYRSESSDPQVFYEEPCYLYAAVNTATSFTDDGTNLFETEGELFTFPPTANTSGGQWWVQARATNRSAKIRVKGWQYGDHLSEENQGYGNHVLRTDVPTYIYLGYVPATEDDDADRTVEDENDWQFNLQRLSDHGSIGQYILSYNQDVLIQGLNDSAKVRINRRQTQISPNIAEPPTDINLTAVESGGTLTDDTLYHYAITALVKDPYNPPDLDEVNFSARTVFTGESGDDSNSVELTWNEVEGAEGYVIYRNGNAIPDWSENESEKIAVISDSTQTSFTDTGSFITENTQPAPTSWTGLIYVDLSAGGPAVSQINRHNSIGQIIAWPIFAGTNLPGHPG